MRVAAQALAIFLVIGVGSVDAQWLNHPWPGIPRTNDGKADLSAAAPRTADGKPDFSGVWGLDAGPSLFWIPAEPKPEKKAWLEKLLADRDENIQLDDPGLQCLPCLLYTSDAADE